MSIITWKMSWWPLDETKKCPVGSCVVLMSGAVGSVSGVAVSRGGGGAGGGAAGTWMLLTTLCTISSGDLVAAGVLVATGMTGSDFSCRSWGEKCRLENCCSGRVGWFDIGARFERSTLQILFKEDL